MTDAVLVIGSGPSGVHAAATLLERGVAVRMVDVGVLRPDPVEAEASLNDLKRNLGDSRSYFLGNDWESLVLNDAEGAYYEFPPSKQYVFAQPEAGGQRTRGFAPLMSHAAGGLAEAWTGGSYPFDERDLEDWPLGWEDLASGYARVAGRIGVSGSADDDLATHFPVHDGLQTALALDPHSQQLLDRYAGARQRWLRAGARMGRARVATLSQPIGERPACHYCGRCQWGCPSDAFYTPSVTLNACRADPNFEYVRGHRVTHLDLSSEGRARAAVATGPDGEEVRFPAERILLAAGTLNTAEILLRSFLQAASAAPELGGLMDNRQVLMPFVNLALLGEAFADESYQYHQVAIGLDRGGARDYVHCLITTLTTALVHPVIQALPFSMRTNLSVFRNIHAALALLNVNFADYRRPENRVALEADGRGGHRVAISYRPADDEPERVRAALRRLRWLLAGIGCIAPPPMTQLRPMGASVHYAGTFPMSAQGDDLSTDLDGRLRACENVWLVDGSGFPSLPAKNLTFTLMANATRIAEEAF